MAEIIAKKAESLSFLTAMHRFTPKFFQHVALCSVEPSLNEDKHPCGGGNPALSLLPLEQSRCELVGS